MDKKLFTSLITINLSLILFFAFWVYQKNKAAEDSRVIIERLDRLEGDGAPNLALKDVRGRETSLYAIEADIILVNFWASWCAPCVIEYPALLRLVDMFDGKVKLVAISQDEDKRDLERFLARFGEGSRHVMHFWDPEGELAELMGTEKLPETYILDRNYRLIRKVPNAEDWDSEPVVNYIRHHMENRAGEADYVPGSDPGSEY